ncbi:dolichyldiphosphatase [Yamadazyma tenuis]|uniref:Phosphatidic acid phosphatase type 2/haloperoxidase domain-containing protein n=1 Tax=Candida tenuis (strain ATCC 10573 / BCRC 21748 / CBS 615 / JCM 9827 / NBRC 10315 / NRRL Y-1498 / VKM Y-70) TaxID=590646 RepID=G3BD06_CANTC|nr:uncharacterized protein CANTEDRAFT_110965 [Yamadazyma tenuis ATCC 10573]EGV60889.1 hypothetical protein CANTEDRAFT_110965 [Yamadazyma tenuis ATCC 10573]WEJ93841.1 dolichyldiphosphatase [Yamadazyma tenuis]
MPTYEKYNPVPFDLTYVVYDPNDPLGLLMVHFSLFPIYTMVFYASWFLLSREVEPVIVVAGHLASEIVNKITKKILREPRPDFHKDFGTGSLTYGMPSAHGQHMGFFAGYFICILLFKINHITNHQKMMGCAALAFSSMGVCFSRVYLKYHTPQQVLVGTLFGAFLGCLYFVVSSILRDVGVVDWVLSWRIVKFFYIKDSYFHAYQSFKDEYEFYLSLKNTNILASNLTDAKI